MAIRNVDGVDFNRLDYKEIESLDAKKANTLSENAPVINLDEEISNAAEEMENILSAFGRFSKSGRKNDSADNDFVSSMLEDKADEKLDVLIKQVAKARDRYNLLNFARQLFPNDSDLMLAMREMLLSAQLSKLQKKKIKEAIADLEKFGDCQKMQSGINIGHLAKRFSQKCGDRSLSMKDLRDSYLSFLELDLPASFIYKDWIDFYGCQNRKLLLAFTLSALVADMKANEPGIHFSEFGPLSAKLSDARILHTLDISLNESFNSFAFRDQMRKQQLMLGEEHIVALYMAGLVDSDNFKPKIQAFSNDFMSLLLLKQRARVIQELRNIYNLTPDFLFAATLYRDVVLDMFSALLHAMYEKERKTGIWNDYYK